MLSQCTVGVSSGLSECAVSAQSSASGPSLLRHWSVRTRSILSEYSVSAESELNQCSVTVYRGLMSHMAVAFVDIAAEDIAPGSRGAFGLLICEIRLGL